MVSFRRCITALAVLALFVGLAGAQIGIPNGPGNSPLVCTGNAAVNPQLRGEGFTELTGDIVITCTGGQPQPNLGLIPAANITVFVQGSTAITSRLLSTSNTLPQASEALLLIDDPGANLPGPAAGFGSSAVQVPCTTPLTGCAEFALDSGSGVQVAVGSDHQTQGPNVFQGIVGTNGPNTVTFYGVPILAPASAGIQHTYRITNVRVTAAGLPDQAQVSAFLSSNGSTALPITATSLLIGVVANPSMNFSISPNPGNTFLQCNSTTGLATTVKFAERIGTAFKTRVVPLNTTVSGTPLGTGTNILGGASYQNVPGGVYNGSLANSESGFIFPAFTGGGNIAGLADYGTRLKAVFFNIPTGVKVYAPINMTGTTASAQMVFSETIGDGTSGAFVTGSTVSFASGNWLQLNVVGGSATAVWEVTGGTNSTESLSAPIWISYTADTANNLPSPTSGQVLGSYAPEPSQGAFSATNGPKARNDALIPRFAAPTGTPLTFMNIAICQTALLWPFVTAVPGFDTGLAISNTTTDPFDTGAQKGSCTLHWYGPTQTATGAGPAPPATLGCDQPGAGAICVPVISSGTSWANTASTLLPNSGFQGYAIAVCNFQYAHGYAAISDSGIQHFLSSYLALVLQGPNGFLVRDAPSPVETLTH